MAAAIARAVGTLQAGGAENKSLFASFSSEKEDVFFLGELS
jgi:hypothetical protein